MKIPVALKHKPVFTAEDYDIIDRGLSPESEAKGLSLGLAQWNDRGNLEISAKIWRYTGEKWSRQSEEMPLHRVLDLAMLICRAKIYLQEEAYRFPKLYDEQSPKIERIAVQGSALDIGVCTDNPMIDEDIKLFAKVMSENDELLSERLQRLANMLCDAGYVQRPIKK